MKTILTVAIIALLVFIASEQFYGLKLLSNNAVVSHEDSKILEQHISYVEDEVHWYRDPIREIDESTYTLAH